MARFMNKGTAKKFIIEKKGNKNVNWMGHTFHLFYDLKKKKEEERKPAHHQREEIWIFS